jgi:hypothetical protein
MHPYPSGNIEKTNDPFDEDPLLIRRMYQMQLQEDFTVFLNAFNDFLKIL